MLFHEVERLPLLHSGSLPPYHSVSKQKPCVAAQDLLWEQLLCFIRSLPTLSQTVIFLLSVAQYLARSKDCAILLSNCSETNCLVHNRYLVNTCWHKRHRGVFVSPRTLNLIRNEKGPGGRLGGLGRSCQRKSRSEKMRNRLEDCGCTMVGFDIQ